MFLSVDDDGKITIKGLHWARDPDVDLSKWLKFENGTLRISTIEFPLLLIIFMPASRCALPKSTSVAECNGGGLCRAANCRA